jgi:hypothetical protein
VHFLQIRPSLSADYGIAAYLEKGEGRKSNSNKGLLGGLTKNASLQVNCDPAWSIHVCWLIYILKQSSAKEIL